MDSWAASGNLVLNNSPSIVKGQYYTPKAVLDPVAGSKVIADGVIEIVGRDLTGRMGVKNNAIITGAVIDSTGETGTAAVCRLLLLPFGNYTFRSAVPSDQLHLQQDLNLTFEDAKRFLAGPSSIGLAVPGKTTLNNLKALTGEEALDMLSNERLTAPVQDMQPGSEEGPDLTWNRSNFCDDYSRKEHERAEAANLGKTEYIDDCKKLVQEAEKKRAQTLEIQIKEQVEQQRNTMVEKPGPLPKRQQQAKPMDVKMLTLGVVAFLGITGASMVSDYLIKLQHGVAYVPPAPKSVGETLEDGRKAIEYKPEPEKVPEGTTAPFDLPAGGSNTAPPDVNHDKAKDSQDEPPPIQTTDPLISQSIGAPTSSQLGNEEVTRWVSAVTKNPQDPDARRELAQAYLMKGDTTASIEQFYSLMKLRRVESDEIIGYSNNLMVFGNKELARQFLTNILRSDPARTEIRNRLAEMH